MNTLTTYYQQCTSFRKLSGTFLASRDPCVAPTDPHTHDIFETYRHLFTDFDALEIERDMAG